jgi:molybdenum cofactor cytidylyltransferase
MDLEMDRKIVDGIVLAAGASSRMGTDKSLLEVDGTTFLERAIHVLRQGGCRYVVAVVNSDDWATRLADVSGAAAVTNDRPDSEQIDSLQLGIANLPEDCDAVAVLPVDIPRVQAQTVQRLLSEFEKSGAQVLNPSYNGEAGHPVIFARSLFPELLRPDLPEGARSVSANAQKIDVDDPGILLDVDTPADYQKIESN